MLHFAGEFQRMIKRSAKLTVGILLLLLGILITPLPIPFGLLSILIGLSILVSVVPAVRRWLIVLRRRFKHTSTRLNQLSPRLPAFLRQLIEETDPEQQKH